MKKKNSSKDSSQKERLTKIGTCEWCEEKKSYLYKHYNDHFEGWFCFGCIDLVDACAEAINNDNS